MGVFFYGTATQHGASNTVFHFTEGIPIMRTCSLVVCLVGCCLTFPSLVDAQTRPVIEGPPGAPWFALGRDVYRANELQAAEGKLLEFLPQSRWFQAFPKPVTKAEYDAWLKTQAKQTRLQEQETPTNGEPVYQVPGETSLPRRIEDLAQVDRGVRLQLGTEPSTAVGELHLTLTLSTKDRGVRREVEHRYTNVLPFLFQILADGKPLAAQPETVFSMRGSHSLVELVPANDAKTWHLRVDQKSLDALLPTGTKELKLTAAFSERQHVLWTEGVQNLGEVWNLSDLHPQLLIRSNTVKLVRNDAGWGVR